ncbi:MAG: hypothetical protein WCJ56_06920 [bacterium]
MSNMSNDTLTPTDERPPQRRRRSPWRIVFAILSLAAGGWYAWHTAPVKMDAYEAARHNEIVNTISPMVEALEQEINPPALRSISELPQLTPAFFDANDSVAYVRLWSTKRELMCEVTRQDSKTILTTGKLPDLGAAVALRDAIDWTHDETWRKPIIDIRPIFMEQSSFTDTLSSIVASGKVQPNNKANLYNQQMAIISAAELQINSYPEIRAAMAPMNNALNIVGEKEDLSNIKLAADLSMTAETALSVALENKRMVFDETGPLPQALAGQAPPGGLLASVWQDVSARRVMAPVFGNAFEDNPIPTAVVVEIGSFSRPYELWQSVVLACWPSLVALLVALLFLIWPRHKTKKEKAMENYENPPFSFDK